MFFVVCCFAVQIRVSFCNDQRLIGFVLILLHNVYLILFDYTVLFLIYSAMQTLVSRELLKDIKVNCFIL